MFSFERRAPWRDEAEQACNAAKAVQPSADFEPGRTINGPGACGMLQPWRVTAFAGGEVHLTSRATLACPIIPQIDRWIAELLQPAAEMYFGARVTDLRAGSYSCRGMNNQSGAPLSEHSFGNAVDVMSFRFADGREVTVKNGWRGSQQEQEFLREVFVGSCRYFSTVLGPGADAYHSDHFHLDLARHNRGRTICKPIIKFAPRLDPMAPMTPRPWQPAPRREEPDPSGQPAPEEPMDIGGLYPELGETGTVGRMSLTPPAPAASDQSGEPQMDEPVDAPFIRGVRPPGTVGSLR
jgi:hypothetical protein